MDQGMQKLAGDLQGVLRSSAEHLVKLANAHSAALAVNKQQDHELKAYKLARRMEQRGLCSELDYEAKVALLLETPVEKLATMEQAVEFATGGFRLGAVEADDKTATASGTSPDVLDSFISSQSAYT